MIILDLFYLLRPGEYTGTKLESTPFHFCNAGLCYGKQFINVLTACEAAINSATFTTLTLTTQKNRLRGEVINQGASKDPSSAPRQPWSTVYYNYE